MAQAQKKSNQLLYLTLLATLAATIWVSMNDEKMDSEVDTSIVQPIKATQASSVASISKKQKLADKNTLAKNNELQLNIPWQQLARSHDVAAIEDIFKPHSWVVVVPPPPPPPEPPTPPPQAPPVPFVYMGKMVDVQNAGKIFLTQNNKFYYVAKGENINAEWRFDKEEANVIRLTYLPLNLAKTLSKASKRPAAQPVSTDAAFEPN